MMAAIDEVRLIDEVGEAWGLIRNRPQRCHVAVFVTEDGVHACVTGGEKHRQYVLQYGHGEVGTYNRVVPYQMLLDDVFHEARAQGLVV